MKREKKLVESTIILFIGNIVPRLVQFVLLPLLTSHLSKKEYGLYELVATLVACLVPLAIIQMNSAAFRFLLDSKSDKDREIIISTIVMIVLTCLLLLNIFVIGGLLLRHKTNLVVIVIYFFFECILTLEKDIIRGLSKNKLYSLISIMQSVLNLILISIVFLLDSNKLRNLYISLSVAAIISISVGLFGVKIQQYLSPKYVSVNQFKEMMFYAIPMIPNGLSHWIVDASDRLLVSCFLGLEFNGIYSAAAKIPAMLNLLQTTFVNAWQENASIYMNDGDSSLYFSKTFKRIFSLFLAATMTLVAFLPLLFYILLGNDYNLAYNHIIILIFGIFFNILSSVIGGLYVALKKSKEIGVSTLIAALINLSLNGMFIKFIGLYAASLSTAISYFLLFIYRLKDIKKYVALNVNYKYIFSNICILLIICMAQLLRNNVVSFFVFIFVFLYSVILNKEILKVNL